MLFLPKLLFGAYNGLEQFPIKEKDRERMALYLLPEDDPIKACMDHLFLSSRVTEDYDHFIDAGFLPYYVQPRSFIIVAGHPLLPGYLLKLQLDTELRIKLHKPCWEWFIRRCEGAKKIREIIEENGIKHFVVAEKWLYPLPLEPSPPQTPDYEQKLLVVLVKDMELVSKEENRKAWNTEITKEHLDELYLIFKNAYPSSFRPDNIAYTKNGKFALIDTEYHLSFRPPHFKKIRSHLNDEMREYWDALTSELVSPSNKGLN